MGESLIRFVVSNRTLNVFFLLSSRNQRATAAARARQPSPQGGRHSRRIRRPGGSQAGRLGESQHDGDGGTEPGKG